MATREREVSQGQGSIESALDRAAELARNRRKSQFDTTDIAEALGEDPVIASLYKMAGIEVGDLHVAIESLYPTKIRREGLLRRRRPHPLSETPTPAPLVKTLIDEAGRTAKKGGKPHPNQSDLFVALTNLTKEDIGFVRPIFDIARGIGKKRREEASRIR